MVDDGPAAFDVHALDLHVADVAVDAEGRIVGVVGLDDAVVELGQIAADRQGQARRLEAVAGGVVVAGLRLHGDAGRGVEVVGLGRREAAGVGRVDQMLIRQAEADPGVGQRRAPLEGLREREAEVRDAADAGGDGGAQQRR